MTVRITKPEFNLREKLSELDYSRVPYEKMPAGSIIQVVSAYKGDSFSTSSTNFVDITGLSATITPRFANSKILVQCSMGAAGTTQSNNDHGNAIRTMRSIAGGTFSDDNKLNGLVEGSRIGITYKGSSMSYNSDHMPGGFGFVGLDDPTTASEVVYKIQVACQSTSYAFHLNRSAANVNDGTIFHSTAMTSLILMEVLQ